MDYKAAGAPKMGKNAPKHREHNQHGSAKKPFGATEAKADLLLRMKKAQNPAKETKYDVPSDPADDTYKDEGRNVPGRARQDKA
ncbi:hypothetical protein [Yoonia sp. 208BN28-4]|uniref:hypothetical protein n=1 Tax=Yoonia sp. 208BN28-4 TaxID=3126505 RepID=UPI00309AF5D1